ncbi:hypothetical protein GmHk_04G010919 [Glycine max]|nr:hypothetical protein GmHk_04G010919 [Glycine max]
MALKKLHAKRARKTSTGEGSSTAPPVDIEFDGHHFQKFQADIVKRQWTQLVEPMAKYDPEVVMEFYANAWPTEEGIMDKHSRVWGQ